jgi:hypothetical protein
VLQLTDRVAEARLIGQTDTEKVRLIKPGALFRHNTKVRWLTNMGGVPLKKGEKHRVATRRFAHVLWLIGLSLAKNWYECNNEAGDFTAFQ